jgi:hypothetical protein
MKVINTIMETNVSRDFIDCIGLARMLHEGNEDQGKYGKQGWSIARRCIAIAMDQGGSIKIGSQIFPEFVQAQSVFSNMSIS